MSDLNGLANAENFRIFCMRWRKYVTDEAKEWTLDLDSKRLLTDAVLNEFRIEYKDCNPPDDMRIYIHAETCRIISITGKDPDNISNYIKNQQKSAPWMTWQQDMPVAMDKGKEEISKRSVYKVTGRGVARLVENTDDKARKSAYSDVNVKQEEEKSNPAKERISEKTAPKCEPDTFVDPVRTQLWITGGLEHSEYVVKEVVIPDEMEENPRSPKHSLINTLLFVAMIISLVFMIYETRVIQHYFQ